MHTYHKITIHLFTVHTHHNIHWQVVIVPLDATGWSVPYEWTKTKREHHSDLHDKDLHVLLTLSG